MAEQDQRTPKQLGIQCLPEKYLERTESLVRNGLQGLMIICADFHSKF